MCAARNSQPGLITSSRRRPADISADSLSESSLDRSSHRSSRRSHQSSRSRRTQASENAILQAAQRKAELQARADGLRKRLAIEKEQLNLRAKAQELDHEYELLGMEEEINVETAKLATLQLFDLDTVSSASSRKSSLKSLPVSDGRQEVYRWLDRYGSQKKEDGNGNGVEKIESRKKVEPRNEEKNETEAQLQKDGEKYIPPNRRPVQVPVNDDKHIPETHRQVNNEDTSLQQILTCQNQLTRLLIDQQIKSSLPAQRIVQFSGDYLSFTSFLRSIEYGIEAKTQNHMDRLYYLDQFTQGEPNNIVKSCMLYENAEEGYLRAKDLLMQKYGNTHKIAEAFLRKARDWSEIKPERPEELNRFALFLAECLAMMGSLRALEELNNTTSIQALVSKLPYRMRALWRSQAFKIEDENRRRIEFCDFVEFVDRQSKIMSNPAFGNLNVDHTSTSKGTKAGSNPSKPSKRGAFATTVTGGSKKACLFCDKDNHELKRCKRFEKESAEEKSEFCFKNMLCFGCLQAGHMKSKCPQLDRCDICKKRHPTVLHDPKRMSNVIHDKDKKDEQKQAPLTGCMGIPQEIDTNHGNPLMAVIPVIVKLPSADRTISTYAFMDDGCGAVFVDPKLCACLYAKTRQRNLLLRTLNATEVVNSAVVTGGMQVTSMDKATYIDLPEVYVREIPVTVQDMPIQEDLDKYVHLSQLQLPTLKGDVILPKVSIMIGMNVPQATMPLEFVTGKIGEPYAVKTPLGWVVHGMPGRPTCKQQDDMPVNFCHAEVIDGLRDLEQKFQSYVNMEFNDNLSDHRMGRSAEDQRFLKQVENHTEFREGHYHVPLPFRNDNLTMPNNRQQAEKRAESLRRKFLKNPKYREDYNKAMQKVIGAGYAEIVPSKDQHSASADSTGKRWYIPHHGVVHPQKQKLRIVYDCAAEYKHTSLNKELMQGPDMTNNLVGVLLRFRQEPVAILADIEAMFYQVRVPRSDVDFLRFLWWPDGDVSKPLQDYRMLVHTFGATSSPACANYALKKTAADNASNFDAEVVDTIQNNFYVDDCLKSVATETKAVSLAQDLRAICKKGGFRLTKWISNSKKVLETVPADERAEAIRDLDLDNPLPSQKALGLLWKMEMDQFGFQIDLKREPSDALTRRRMLSTICSLYDPLGFVSPVILPGKQMLQELCRLKLGWDEDVPDDCKKRWVKWLMSLPDLHQFKIERCWKPIGFEVENLKAVQVHHFSDASESGYGVASYLRLVNNNNDIECNLILSKSRVAPIKQVSIPRMELTAATVSVKTNSMLSRELEVPVHQSIFWTDSETVLKYIKNDKTRYPVFVANRIAVIRDGSDIYQWRYVPSKLNPADHASRGLTVSQLLSLNQWLKGPDFLQESEDKWPEKQQSPEAVVEKEEQTHEDETDVLANAVVLGDPVKENTETVQDTELKDPVHEIIRHYSDLLRLKRAVAWWLRLRRVLLDKSKGVNQEVKRGPLTTEEIEHAEHTMIKSVQRLHFPDECKTLKDMQKSNCIRSLKKGSSLAKLDPVMIDGMMCVGGRLRKASIPEQAKHQIILPKNHHLSTLIIRYTHRKLRHQGRSHVLADLRLKYWIIQAAVSVKKEVKKCVICRRVQATVSTQKMADLPANRLQADEPPFTHTGVDYFGPFHIKQGRTVRKRYGVVFTCMASRAVHLEVAGSLDTDACINALRRFISRRGPVKEITSDNGTNLVGANEELRRAFKAIDQDTLQRFTTNTGIIWKFNPPAASHQGGVWERQIRTIRKILNAILLEQHLKTCRTEEELYTFLCEVESIINSRPLTRVTDDPADMKVITPNDLLLLAPGVSLPPGSFNEKDIYARKRWRQVQYLAEVFWKRWTREYLPTLQERQKWLQAKRNLQVGDIVLVVDDKAPRNSWCMGRVEEVFVGNQGLIRSASIKTKSSVLKRPVTKLCLLLEQES